MPFVSGTFRRRPNRVSGPFGRKAARAVRAEPRIPTSRVPATGSAIGSFGVPSAELAVRFASVVLVSSSWSVNMPGSASSPDALTLYTSGRLWLRAKVSAARGRKLGGLRTNWDVLPSTKRTRRACRPWSSAGSSAGPVYGEGAAPLDSGAGSVRLVWDPPGNDPSRAWLGPGPLPSAAAGAGESPLLESIAPWGSDAAAAGLHGPAADGTGGGSPVRSSVSPIRNGCPNTAPAVRELILGSFLRARSLLRGAIQGTRPGKNDSPSGSHVLASLDVLARPHYSSKRESRLL
jgi:hypothetical protein